MSRHDQLYNCGFKDGAVSGHALAKSDMLKFAIDRWHAEVSQRPLINVYRRTLDNTWRQVITAAGGDPESLVGPKHDDLLDESGNPMAKG